MPSLAYAQSGTLRGDVILIAKDVFLIPPLSPPTFFKFFNFLTFYFFIPTRVFSYWIPRIDSSYYLNLHLSWLLWRSYFSTYETTQSREETRTLMLNLWEKIFQIYRLYFSILKGGLFRFQNRFQPVPLVKASTDKKCNQIWNSTNAQH